MAQEEAGFSNAGASKGSGGCSARLRRFGHAVCNTEKGEFLGRTASSWAKIGIFYIIFYSCLAGFFAVMLVGFFATLDEKTPTQKKMYSLIKGNPGMGFRPMPNIEMTLIKVNEKDLNVQSIESVMKEYRTFQNGTVVNCTAGERAGEEEVCEVPLDNFGPCTLENNYGYDNGTPCVLLKLNRVFDWTPQAFSNDSEGSEEIKKRHEDAVKALGDRISNDHVGISCEGENDADLDTLGRVEFYPEKGFPFNYYPYKNQLGYRSPLVFARFPELKKGILIQVWCKLWAANIKHHKNDKAGSAHFEILFD